MRVRPLLLPIIALLFAFTLVACSGADDPPRVTTTLECQTPGGPVQSCTLTLPVEAGYTITLVSSSCDAINNEVRLIRPIDSVLTTDACRTAAGTQWDFLTPTQPAGTEIDIEVDSDQFAGAPGLRVSGDYPSWTIRFEDGFDVDFNDIELRVDAVPAAVATVRN